MPTAPHVEKHFMGSETLRDIVIGMADGPTVPFFLAAGLSAAVSSIKIIATPGMAEIVAGAVAMGLGGYLAARTDQEHYASEERRELAEVELLREREVAQLETILKQYGLTGEPLSAVVAAVTSDRKRWVEFMMRFALGQ
jgi:vacuolar iron transporter family protein